MNLTMNEVCAVSHLCALSSMGVLKGKVTAFSCDHEMLLRAGRDGIPLI